MSDAEGAHPPPLLQPFITFRQSALYRAAGAIASQCGGGVANEFGLLR